MPVLRLRRGTTAQNNALTGQSGEITMDTDLKTLRVHDGVTAGGTALAKKSEVDAAQTTANNAQTAAANANSNANSRVPLTGGEMTGELTVPTLSTKNGSPTGATYASYKTSAGTNQWVWGATANRELFLNAYDDSGNFVSTALMVNRSGQVFAAAYGWLHDRFATKGQFHHNVSITNCGAGTAISSAVDNATNTMTLTLTNTNCNCNCNCNCRC